MITFGLTGGIAMGKSTVTKTFRAYNIPMVDADIVARQVVEPGTKGLNSVIRAFGQEYLNEDGTLNRTKLGALVFSDIRARWMIDDIMAPLINEESTIQIKKLHSEGNQIVGYDAALICEMGNAGRYRPLIVVQCPRDMQIERLMGRNQLTLEAAVARIDAQMSIERKVQMADFVIDTSLSIQHSVLQTEVVLYEIQKLNEISSNTSG